MALQKICALSLPHRYTIPLSLALAVPSMSRSSAQLFACTLIFSQLGLAQPGKAVANKTSRSLYCILLQTSPVLHANKYQATHP